MRHPSTATFRVTFWVIIGLILSPLACQVREAGEPGFIEEPPDPAKMILKGEAIPVSDEKNAYGVMLSWKLTEAVVIIRTEMRRDIDGPLKSTRNLEFAAGTQEYLDKDISASHTYTYQIKPKDGRVLSEKLSTTKVKVPFDGGFIFKEGAEVQGSEFISSATWNRFYLAADRRVHLIKGDYHIKVEELHIGNNALIKYPSGPLKDPCTLSISARKAKGHLNILPGKGAYPVSFDFIDAKDFDCGFDTSESDALPVPELLSLTLGNRKYITLEKGAKPVPFGIYEDNSGEKPKVIAITPRGFKYELKLMHFAEKETFMRREEPQVEWVSKESDIPAAPYQLVTEDAEWAKKGGAYLELISMKKIITSVAKLGTALAPHRVGVYLEIGGTGRAFSQSQVQLLDLINANMATLAAELKEHKVRDIEISSYAGSPSIDDEGKLHIPSDLASDANENLEHIRSLIRTYIPKLK